MFSWPQPRTSAWEASWHAFTQSFPSTFSCGNHGKIAWFVSKLIWKLLEKYFVLFAHKLLDKGRTRPLSNLRAATTWLKISLSWIFVWLLQKFATSNFASSNLGKRSWIFHLKRYETSSKNSTPFHGKFTRAKMNFDEFRLHYFCKILHPKVQERKWRLGSTQVI